jgi:fructokinase
MTVPSETDVLCVGEALVDFLPQSPDRRVRDVDAWHQCPGGAPSNVAVGLARLGARVALNGVVGDDEFGHFLVRRLGDEGVDVSHLRMTTEGRTGLSFVSLTRAGERSFCFYRSEAAEQFFGPTDVDAAFVQRSRVVHLGLNAMRRPAAQDAVLAIVDAATKAGRVVSCDPNLRLHLWDEPGAFKALLGAVLPRCTIVKMAADETQFVLGTPDPETAVSPCR